MTLSRTPAGALVLVALLAAGCAAVDRWRGPGRPPRSETVARTQPPFSGAAAFTHLEALAALGPRPSGSAELAQARAYVNAQLEAVGLEPESVSATLEISPTETLTLEAPIVEIPGDSTEVVLLVTPIDTAPIEEFPFVGANESASGAGVLLELARVLSEEPASFTVILAFADGDHLDARSHQGSRMLIAALAETGTLEKVRAVVYVRQVGDRDLVVARDSSSSRPLRDAMFEEAAELGHADVFRMDAGFEDAGGGHVSFDRAGVPLVLSIADPRYGGDEAPGAYWRTEEDTVANCSPDSLEVVGDVLVASIRSQADRWNRLDAIRGTSSSAGAPQPPAEAEGSRTPDETPAAVDGVSPEQEPTPDTAATTEAEPLPGAEATEAAPAEPAAPAATEDPWAEPGTAPEPADEAARPPGS